MSRGIRNPPRPTCACAISRKQWCSKWKIDGVGFPAVKENQGMGLISMRERAELVNGQIEFLPRTGGGALVRLTVAAYYRGYPCRLLASRFCWWTIIAWCAADSAACWKTIPKSSVVGEASDGNEAVEKAAELRPHVVVMDFALPSMNGAVATRHILKASPEIKILMLSMHSEPSYVRTCLDAGARGYLLKNAVDLELVSAVKQVAAGEQVLDPRLGRLRR